MTKNETIQHFIYKAFRDYGLQYRKYFGGVDEDYGEYIIPLLDGDEFNMSMVKQAAEILGAEVEDLLSMNEQEIYKWLDRFPYIDLREQFQVAYNDAFYKANYAERRVMEAIFGGEAVEKHLRRFDTEDVCRRLLNMYKEYDKTVPGTYHDGVSIKHLHIRTSTFCQFPEMKRMMESLFEMVGRAESLFHKAFEGELEPEEIREFNILAIQLGMRDRVCKAIDKVNYRTLKALIPLFQEEGKKQLLECFLLDPDQMIMPWRCAEFLEDKEMVQKFVNIAPYAKSAMREHAMAADNFHCGFAWADAEPLEYRPLSTEEDSVLEIGNALHYVQLRDAYDNLTPCYAYVPKTTKELGQDGEYAKKLKMLCGPVAKGGVSVPVGVGVRDDSDSMRTMRHIAAMVSGRHE